MAELIIYGACGWMLASTQWVPTLAHSTPKSSQPATRIEASGGRVSCRDPSRMGEAS